MVRKLFEVQLTVEQFSPILILKNLKIKPSKAVRQQSLLQTEIPFCRVATPHENFLKSKQIGLSQAYTNMRFRMLV